METTRNIAPMNLGLLITIVDPGKAAYFASLIQSCDSNLRVSVQAKGTAQAEILNYLGLTETSKTVLFNVVREDRAGDLINLLDEKFSTVKGGKGIAVLIPLSSVIGTLIYGFLSNDKRTVKEEA